MGVFQTLESYGQLDYKGVYNSLLSDYLNDYPQDKHYELFKQIVEVNDEICIYKNFSLTINHELISNKKIGYRDIGKVPAGFYKINYLLYWNKDEKERAIIINEDSYIEARGVYYCLSEPDGQFYEDRCDILAYYLKEDDKQLVDIVKQLQNKDTSIGYIQKHFDSQAYSNEEDMRDDSVTIARELFEKCLQEAPTLEKQEKTYLIYNTICRVFLLKKSLYVRYMTNKFLLKDRHDNNVAQQRKFAKAYVDEIVVVPNYQLWNGVEQIEENEEALDN